VFATATIVPLPVWLRLRADPFYDTSYWQFLPSFFDVHLALSDFPFILQGEQCRVILLGAVPLAVLSGALVMEVDLAAWNRWAYLVFYLYGFLLAADARFVIAVRREAVAALLGAPVFVVSVALFAAHGGAGGEPFTDYALASVVGRSLLGAAGRLWSVAILGLLGSRGLRPARALTKGDSRSSTDRGVRVPQRGGPAHLRPAPAGR
jgi:hypothetical protein